MKTKEELTALKAEVETLNKRLAELSEDELKQVTGGVAGNGVILVTAEGPAPEKGNTVMGIPMGKYESA